MISLITSFCSALCNSRFIGENKKKPKKKSKEKNESIQMTLDAKNALYMESKTCPPLSKWRTTQFYCYLGIYWSSSIGRCLFYVWTGNINIKVIPFRKEDERKEKNQRKILNLYDFVHVLLSCYSLQRAPSHIWIEATVFQMFQS